MTVIDQPGALAEILESIDSTSCNVADLDLSSRDEGSIRTIVINLEEESSPSAKVAAEERIRELESVIYVVRLASNRR